MPSLVALPGKLQITFWPGYTRTATITLDVADTGYFAGRTFRAEIADSLRLDRTVLCTFTPTIAGDVMTIVFDGDQTADLTVEVGRYQWLLIDTTLGADAPDAQPFIVGRALATDAATGTPEDVDVTVSVGDINVTVSVAAGPPTVDQGDINAAVAAEATRAQTAEALLIPLAQKAAANGVATLGADSKIPAAQLPALAINEVFTVTSQAAMLALTAQRGDVALRTELDPDGFFLLVADDPTILANWVRITAAGAVTSVDGATGAVTLSGTYVPLLDKTITSITYNADGSVQSVAYPGGPTITYTYNADGTVHTSSDGTTTRTFSYNADGTVASVA